MHGRVNVLLKYLAALLYKRSQVTHIRGWVEGKLVWQGGVERGG